MPEARKKFNCSNCGASLTAPKKYGGKRIKCPACLEKTDVPGRQMPRLEFDRPCRVIELSNGDYFAFEKGGHANVFLDISLGYLERGKIPPKKFRDKFGELLVFRYRPSKEKSD